ncbi:YdcF family protein [Aureivirga marina]|uniref:YdcF family protein n=1 Tax=Aureivirga marina TaxID=1182451 RepID=UPI0018C8FDF7|nr:YdcF family protein [Aureivirga marina]
MKKAFKIALVSGIIVFIALEISIVVDGLSDELISENATIVVLGTTVHENGEVSNRLKSRLDEAFSLFQKYKTNTIVVSGGFGKEGHYEGTVMKNYLVKKGIHSDKIIVDNHGNTTRLTAKNFSLNNNLDQEIMVVSQFFHVKRSKLAFKQFGFKNIKGSHAKYFEIRDIYSLFREFFGYLKYYLMY